MTFERILRNVFDINIAGYSIIFEIIDILIVAYIFYLAYTLVEKSNAIQVVKGLVVILFVYFIAKFFNFGTLLSVINEFFKVAFLAVIILFQPELRRFLIKLGENELFGTGRRSSVEKIDALAETVSYLSHKRIGALIVLQRKTGLKNYIETGTTVDAEFSPELTITIFSHKTPLHDGSIIIQGDRIVAASCVLPLTKRTDLHRDFGTRHRAAIGLCEETDAVIIVVSEESGTISIACENKLYFSLPISKFRSLMHHFLTEDSKKDKGFFSYFKGKAKKGVLRYRFARRKKKKDGK